MLQKIWLPEVLYKGMPWASAMTGMLAFLNGGMLQAIGLPLFFYGLTVLFKRMAYA